MSAITLGLSPLWQGIVILSAIAAIAALGLQLTISSGQFSIVHGALAGAGSYITGIACVEHGLGMWAATAVGSASGAVLGAIIALTLRKLEGVLFGLATLAIGQALSLYAANSRQLGGSTGYNAVPLNTELWQPVLFLAIALVLLLRLRASRVGLAITAVGRDQVVAASIGLPILLIKVAAFAAGGALAGLSGALNVQYLSFVDPSALGFTMEVQLLLFVVLGGMTTPLGAVAGAFGVTIASEMLRFAELDRAWLFGLVLMSVALLRPQGLFGRRSVGKPRWPHAQKALVLSQNGHHDQNTIV